MVLRSSLLGVVDFNSIFFFFDGICNIVINFLPRYTHTVSHTTCPQLWLQVTNNKVKVDYILLILHLIKLNNNINNNNIIIIILKVFIIFLCLKFFSFPLILLLLFCFLLFALFFSFFFCCFLHTLSLVFLFFYGLFLNSYIYLYFYILYIFFLVVGIKQPLNLLSTLTIHSNIKSYLISYTSFK